MTEPLRLPTPLTLARAQVDEAISELHRDYTDLPRMPWKNLDHLVGPPLPRDLWVIGARPANGKTTLALNLFDALVQSGTATLYIGAGSEGPPKDLRRQWAALRLGLPVHAVMGNEWAALPSGAQDRVAAELERQADEDRDYAHFASCERLTSSELVAALKGGRAAGCGYVILDHIHRLRFDAQTDLRRGLSEATRFLRDWAAKHETVVLVCAQLHRAPSVHGALRDLIPPVAADLKETGTLEEDAVVILLLHRVRKADVDQKACLAVARGERPIDDIVEPQTVAVRIGKHRRAGHIMDQTAFLRLDGAGRMTVRDAVWKGEREREPGEELPF